MDLQLGGRTALVVGGSRGIGRAAALALAAEGANVAIIARTAEAVGEAVKAVEATGRRGLGLPLDIGDGAALDAAWKTLTDTLGPPTLLVLSAAAFFKPTRLQFVEPGEVRAMVEGDLISSIELCRRALPGMMDARFGRIVAIGSVGARTGVAGSTVYSTTKAGLEGLVRGLALDYSRRNITANVVEVGFAETERLVSRINGDDAARARLVNATAQKRLTAPSEIGDVVAFLCSPRAAAITGAVVEATGGAHLNNVW